MRAYSQSAIVLGASMSGLLAAKALSNHFQRVTLHGQGMSVAATEAKALDQMPRDGNHGPREALLRSCAEDY